MKQFYILLMILGIVLPYWQLFGFMNQYGGWDTMKFFEEVFATYGSRFIAADLTVTGLAAITFMVVESKRLGMKRLWLPIASIFLVGVSLGLPLFLYLREVHLDKVKKA